MSRIRNRRHRSGFTLIEVLLVLVILVVVLVSLGLFPQLLMNMISTGTAPLVDLFARVAEVVK